MLGVCADICDSINKICIDHISSWRMFMDSSVHNLELILLHRAYIPKYHSVKISQFVDIIGDSYILLGFQDEFTKYCYFYACGIVGPQNNVL